MQNLLAVVSLKKIIRNALLVIGRAGTELFAVVKDDAYGHGAERVALALEPIVRGFAVATVFEGAALRTAGVRKEILVLTPCLSEEEACRAALYALTPSVSSFSALHLLGRTGQSFTVQIAVNTGMNRYGFPPAKIRRACRELKDLGFEVSGVFSHLYSPKEEEARLLQTRLFEEAAGQVKEFFPQALRHLASTGGMLCGREVCFDAVRCGLALYGYLPAGFEGELPVTPAMRLYAAAAQNTRFLGGGVCYKKAEKEYGKLCTYRLGYGDGFKREGGICNVNELCMDAFVREGFFPFGKRRLILSDFKAYADSQDMLVYDALVSLTKRAEKKYV